MSKQETIKEKTIAEKIWNEIKDKEIGLFALANQKVQKYCTPIFAEPNRLYIKISCGAVLPSLESALPEYEFTPTDKFIIVSRKK